MAVSNKSLDNKVKEKYIEMFSAFLAEKEEILRTASNEIAFPIVDSEGNEKFLVVKFSIPSGSRDGDAYDGYAVAEDYSRKQAEKIAKAAEAAEKKKTKIAKDKANREKLAKSKAEYKKQQKWGDLVKSPFFFLGKLDVERLIIKKIF